MADASCTASNRCMVATYYGGKYNVGGQHKESEDTGQMRSWDGTEWSTKEVKGNVSRVSCLTASLCVAVGFTGGYDEYHYSEGIWTWVPPVSSAFRWDGSNWTAETPVVAVQAHSTKESKLTGVDCNGNGCSAMGGYRAPASLGLYPVVERLGLTPVNLTLPTASPSTPYEGLSVSATTGSWTSEARSYAYQWRRCEVGGGGCVDISGATSSTYKTTATDAGSTLVVKVKAFGPGGTIEEAFSLATGKVLAAGERTEYSLPASSSPYGIATGPDGNLWFTNEGSDKVGKISTSGTVTEYALPAGSDPTAIVAGPDGKLWYTASSTSKIGVGGTGKAEYALPAGSNPQDITAGPTATSGS